jgi:hypothetical protein
MINTLKTIGISAVVVIVALLLTGAFSGNTGVGGTYEITKQFFPGGISTGPFVQGGSCETLVDADGGTTTLTARQMDNDFCFAMAASGIGQQVIVLQLPTSDQFKLILPNVGDFREWTYDASALAAATTTTILAGTGIDLIGVTNADDVIDGAEYARISCWRKSGSSVACITSELLNTD